MRSRFVTKRIFGVGPLASPSSTSSAAWQRWYAVALVAVAVLGASVLIVALLVSARAEALQSAQVTALNYARTLQVRLDGTFRRADSALLTLAQSIPSEALAPGAESRFVERLERDLDALLSGFDELIALRIADIRGDQRYVSSSGRGQPANYGDRSFFATYRHDPKAELLISEVVTGRVTHRPTVVMSRPLRDAEGRFAGAALAPLELSYFEQQFRQLDIGRNGVVFLRRTDHGELVLRWPPIEKEVNRPMPPDQPILRAVQAGRNESVNEYVAFTDGVRRISGTVVVKNYPFFLTVALAVDDALAGWRRLAWLVGATWTALLVLGSALMLRLWRSDRERRTLELRLRESQRIESLGTLAGGIAHDFNNLVAAILGNVTLARHDLPAGHPALVSLEQIALAGTRARDLVKQILAFGRPQTDRRVNQVLQPLVEECVALLRSTVPASVRLETRLSAAPVHAEVDATQLQQVLMNLGTNAWHALEERDGHIVVGLEALELPGGPQAHLWVQDNGHGMDAATRQRIFEPFFTTKPTGQGTGLGLPVVHGIVTAHGGTLRVDSTPEAGTTVHIYLPGSRTTPASADFPERLPAPAEGRGQHVLVVDDDDVIALMVERLLVRAGYRVSTCRDGRAALRALQADPYGVDLLVTDYNMPGFTGLELAQAVHAQHPTLPVVINSGYITDTLRAEAAAAGVRHIIPKQQTLEDLPRVAASALGA